MSGCGSVVERSVRVLVDHEGPAGSGFCMRGQEALGIGYVGWNLVGQRIVPKMPESLIIRFEIIMDAVATRFLFPRPIELNYKQNWPL